MGNSYFHVAVTILALLLPSAGRAEALLAKDVVAQLRLRTVEVLSDGLIRGGGGIVSQDGLVITAAHLIGRPEAKLEVIAPKLGRRAAELVAVDLGRDLALLRMRLAAGEAVTPLAVAKATPRVGERIFCFGPALRNQPLLLSGMVAEDREVCAEYATFDAYLQCYLVDASAPSLMSGAVWVDERGAIVAIQNGRLNDDGMQPAGIAMVATPAGIRALIAGGKDAATGGIGAWGWELWTASKDHVERYPAGQEGIIVTFLRSKGPLDAAGVGLHDLITHVDGVAVTRRSQFVRLIRGRAPGAKLIMRTLRPDGKTIDRTVTLEDVAGRWHQRK